MKLYCANCDKDATKNADVYENVDGFIFHCGDCNAPIVEISFDEADRMKYKDEDACEAKTEITEEHPNLFDQDFSSVTEDECEECRRCDDTAVLTTEDLEYIYKSLNAKLERQGSAYNKTMILMDKIESFICP